MPVPLRPLLPFDSDLIHRGHETNDLLAIPQDHVATAANQPQPRLRAQCRLSPPNGQSAQTDSLGAQPIRLFAAV